MGVTGVDPPRLFDVRSDESAARAINSADYFGGARVGLFPILPAASATLSREEARRWQMRNRGTLRFFRRHKHCPMKRKFITVVFLAAGGLLSAASGQTPLAAPTVPDAPTAPAAPVADAAPTLAPDTARVTPNQTVYTAHLPTVQEITDAAAARGTNLTRVEQSDSQIVATYQLANGQTQTVVYQILPTAGKSGSATLMTTPPPAVVYVPRSRVVYYDTYPSYDPWYWYPPVSLSFGFGFYGGPRFGGYRHGGYYRGGFGHGFYHRHR